MKLWVENTLYGMELRQKLMLFIVSIIIFFVVLNLFLIRRDYLILNNYNEDNKNYSRISELRKLLDDNNRFLNDYFEESELKDTEGFNDSTLSILSEFNRTGYEVFDTIEEIEGSVKSLDEYLWIQSIENACENYREEANKAVREHNQGITMNQDMVNRMYAYIDVYIDLLSERTALTREEESTKVFDAWNKSKNVTIVLLIIITLIIYMSGSMFSGYLTGSIRRIISLHGRIGQGDFTPEIAGRIGDDEVGQLNKSLQKMQQNIKEQIDSLNEKAVMQKALYEEELRNVEMQKSLNATRYAMLQSQINPHFLFNTLNIISRKAMFKDSDEAVRLIKALSELFRHSLIDVSEKVPLEKELEVVQEYLYIQKSRFGPRLTVVFKNDLSQSSDILIPPLIIQPIVENAIVHGIEPMEMGGQLEITVSSDDSHILVRVKDNGLGIDDGILGRLNEPGKTGSGIGLYNVKQRMEYLNGNNSFMVESSSEGTLVTLKFQI